MSLFISLLNSLPSAIAQGLIWGILAIGVYITYKIVDIADLTVEGTLCTGAAICVILLTSGAPMWLAIFMAILGGVLAGLVTGLLHTKFGIPAILSGILTQLALYSINLHIMGIGTANGSKSNLPISVDQYDLLVSLRYVRNIDWSNPIWKVMVILVIVIGLLYWFFGTELGCSIRATGANKAMARAQGINTNTTIVLSLMISNGIVAFCGALLAQYQGFSDINMGRGSIVIGLAAVIIGEVLFGRWFKNFALILLSCVFGAIIYYIVIAFVLKLGLSTDDMKLLSACVVAIFLAIPYIKSQRDAQVKEK